MTTKHDARRVPHTRWLGCVNSAAALMALFLAPATLRADTFTVDNKGDGPASCKTPKNCTLRAAIQASEADPGASTITCRGACTNSRAPCPSSART